MPQPKGPPRLNSVFPKYQNPIYFVTFGTLNRQEILANPATQHAFTAFGKTQAKRGTDIGRYVIMPDHIHFFIRLNQTDRLGPTIGFLKRKISSALTEAKISGPHWQPGFFDHLLRSADSYSEKWDYVQRNPIRAGLVKEPDEWPYAGEIGVLSY